MRQIRQQNMPHMSTERRSVPVPEALLAAIRERPQDFGVDRIKSEAVRLQRILETGAQECYRQVVETRMAADYAEWTNDTEREAVLATLADEALAAGGFLDQLLSRSEAPPR